VQNEAEKRAKKDARNAAARADRAAGKYNVGIVNRVIKHRRVDLVRMRQAENRYYKEWQEMEEGLERWFVTQRVKYWRESVPSDRPVYCANDYLKLFKGQFTQRVIKDWRTGWGRISVAPGEYGSMLSYFWAFTTFSELAFTCFPSRVGNSASAYNQRRSEKIPTEKRAELLNMLGNSKCDICKEFKEPRSLIIVSIDKLSDAVTDLQCRSCFAKNLPDKKR